MRWKFLSGRGQDGFFATQAHSSKIVGYDASDNEFHADFKRSNDDTAVMAHFINDTHLTLCYNENCIGADAKSKLLITVILEVNDKHSRHARNHEKVCLDHRATFSGLMGSFGLASK